MRKRKGILPILILLLTFILGACGSGDVGVIGGADGPSVVVVGDGNDGTAGSALWDADEADEENTAADGEDLPENRDHKGDSRAQDEDETAVDTIATDEETAEGEYEELPDPDGSYDSKEDVALYIHLYGTLPKNFITKKEAQALGWSGGSLEPYAPGCAIGGSRFGNYEGLLPEKKGRNYTECDIDTVGKKSRGAKRIVFSNDGLIYYTEDHYESFELLYGEE